MRKDQECVLSDLENSRARAEALNESTPRALRSARRAQLWAGLNRYPSRSGWNADQIPA